MIFCRLLNNWFVEIYELVIIRCFEMNDVNMKFIFKELNYYLLKKIFSKVYGVVINEKIVKWLLF